MSQIENYYIATFGTGFKRHILKRENPFCESKMLCGKTGNMAFIDLYSLDSKKQQKIMSEWEDCKCKKCFNKLEELSK